MANWPAWPSRTDEVDRLASQLSSILEYVEKLGELDLDGWSPRPTCTRSSTRSGDDAAGAVAPARRRVLANAPVGEDGCFKVAKVIDA